MEHENTFAVQCKMWVLELLLVSLDWFIIQHNETSWYHSNKIIY